MDSKVSSDWLPIYIKARRPVIEIFKMDRYFPDRSRTHDFQPAVRHSKTSNISMVPVSKVALFYRFSLFG